MSELRKDGFTFKHFFVAHDKSPMKVTTDSTLLGAWAPITHQPANVLDIGCGCGVIGLMLAQRLNSTDCVIDVVDIEPNAVEQCKQNISDSPFNNINAYCADINYFHDADQISYDLIVSNPPYFEPANECRDKSRQQARYTETLSYQQLINNVKRLLTKPNGLFCLVLPYHLSEQFTSLCLDNALYLQQIMHIHYNPTKAASLSLLCFGLNQSEYPIIESLTLRTIEGNYTQQFKQLQQDFYLFRNNMTR